MAILQLSILLGWPEPIPIVVPFLANTIAFDLTNLHILNANIKFSRVFKFGFTLDTTVKFFLEKVFTSEV